MEFIWERDEYGNTVLHVAKDFEVPPRKDVYDRAARPGQSQWTELQGMGAVVIKRKA